METNRTATDILLDIDRKIDILERRIQNSENLLKILLGRFNATVNASSEPKTLSPPHAGPQYVNKNNFEERPKTSEFAKAAAEHGVDVEESETQVLKETFVAQPLGSGDVDSDDLVEAPIRGNARGQRGPKTKGAKSSVSQVLNVGESPLFLANIEVFDDGGQLINQGRTNTKGRWLMALAPGDYQVHVSKRFPPDSGKLPVDTRYQINVPLSDKPLELAPLSVG